jgi:hypothetical protein
MMLKKQLKRWGFDVKYVRRKDAVAMSLMKQERDAAAKDSEFTVRGQPVNWAKVHKHLKRNRILAVPLSGKAESSEARSIIVRTPSPSPPPTPNHWLHGIPAVCLSRKPKLSAEYPLLLRLYTQDALRAQAVAENAVRDTCAMNSMRLIRWRTQFFDAIALMDAGDLTGGFAAVDDALGNTKQVIESGEPNLLKVMLDVSLCFSVAHAELRNRTLHFFAQLSSIVLGREHPAAKLWNGLQNEPEGEAALLQLALESLVDTLESLGVLDARSDDSRYQVYHNHWRDTVAGVTFGEQVHPGFHCHASDPGTQPRTNSILQACFICGALLDAGRLEDAAAVLSGVVQTVRPTSLRGDLGTCYGPG